MYGSSTGYIESNKTSLTSLYKEWLGLPNHLDKQFNQRKYTIKQSNVPILKQNDFAKFYFPHCF